MHRGLASFAFARRYSRNRCFFLFLRLLRCFSSPGSLPYVMDWRMDDWSFSSRVSPFRYLRVNGYLLLTAAFRSLSRLSSALSAKASTLRSFLLDLFWCIALHHLVGLFVFLGFPNLSIRPRMSCISCVCITNFWYLKIIFSIRFSMYNVDCSGYPTYYQSLEILIL